MIRETEAHNRRAIMALDVAKKDHVLDIGCGSGLSLGILAALAPDGRIAGVDPSPLMVKRANARNSRMVDAGRIEVGLASVERLPFANGSVDKVISIHTIYFWEDLTEPFREIARIIKPGGKCALLFRTSADSKAASNFSHEVYNFRSRLDVICALEFAGFLVEQSAVHPVEPAVIIAIKC